MDDNLCGGVYKVGQLVWGKIKGFPYWPAKIIDPNEKPELKRSRKKVFVVQFFGTGEFGCIGLEDMRPYFAFKQKFCVASRKDNFIRAMVECERYVAQNPNMETLELKLNQPTDDEYYQRWVKNCRDDESDAASDELGYFTVAKKPKLETLAEIALEERLNVEKARNSEKKVRSKRVKNESENSTTAKNGSLRQAENSAIKSSDQIELKPISKRIGFIGLGKVGSNLAKRFLKMGNDVLLCSRSVKDDELEKQELIKTPKEVAEKCDVIFVCVSKSEDLKDVVCDPATGILDSIDETKALVDFSTLDLVTTLEISRLITDKGGRYMDAPLFGTLQQARENLLTVFCSGDKSLFKDVQNCLHGTFLSSLYVGAVGTASKVVLILQMLHGVVTAGVAEILSLTDVLGVQFKDVNEIFQRTNVDSWITDAARRIAEDDFVPAAMELGTTREQIKNATNTITTYFDQPIPITSLVSQLYGMASRNEDFIDHDCTSISKALGSSQK